MADRVDVLERLAKLRAEDVLSEDEFVAHKRLVLDAPETAFHSEVAVPARQPSAGVLAGLLGWLLAVLIGLGAYLVASRPVARQAPEPANNLMAAATNETAPDALTPTPPPAPPLDDDQPGGRKPQIGDPPESDVDITDKVVAAEVKESGSWTAVNSGQFCEGDTLTFNNFTKQPLELTIGPEDASSPDLPLGTTRSGSTVQVKLGTGPYIIGHVVKDLGTVQLYRIETKRCDQ